MSLGKSQGLIETYEVASAQKTIDYRIFCVPFSRVAICVFEAASSVSFHLRDNDHFQVNLLVIS